MALRIAASRRGGPAISTLLEALCRCLQALAALRVNECISIQTERVALFIDGANLYATAKSLGFDIDYKRLLALFRQKGQLVRALYYTALAEDQEYSSIRPLIDWLDYNGFTMVTKPTKEFTDATGRRKVKGNMDIELAVDAMRLAENLDHIVLFSGDGDFRSLVARLQQMGKRVQRRLDPADAAADGRRRAAPAGRPVHRPRRSRAAHLPRSGDAAGRHAKGGAFSGGGPAFDRAPRLDYPGDDDLSEEV